MYRSVSRVALLSSVSIVVAFAGGVMSAPVLAGAVGGGDVVAAPRPVVLVHGFTGSAAAWDAYLGPAGFLAGVGLEGYAVGDPSLGGAMDMGRTRSPAAPTSTIAENAAVLAAVIDEVRARTGAATVDLVAHSMGGLVARYYLARVMGERSVGQLLLLGTPNLGSGCAVLPAALGFYLPAALELRPAYLEAVFNPQVTDVGGVPVAVLAGTPITERLRAPCTGVPSDLVVDRNSAAGSGGALVELPVLHTDLTASEEVFNGFVAPRLLGEVAMSAAPAAPAGTDAPGAPPPRSRAAQTTHVYRGVVASGASATLELDLDAVAVASFALFDPSLSLSVRVRGASGAEIELTPAANGFFTVDDPTSLVHLGYGFANPRPGTWSVTLVSGPRTPPEGAEYALTARVVDGASVSARVSEFLPQVGEEVVIEAEAADIDLARFEVTVVVTAPDGAQWSRPMQRVGDRWTTEWQPQRAGVHGIDVVAVGTSLAGLAVERMVALAVEARDASPGSLRVRTLVVAVAALIGVGLLVMSRRYGGPRIDASARARATNGVR